jgi:hypothetical protein
VLIADGGQTDRCDLGKKTDSVPYVKLIKSL